MNTGMRAIYVTVGVVLGLGIVLLAYTALRPKPGDTGGSSGLAAQVDLEPIQRIAVQTSGRVNSFGSFASRTMSTIAGSGKVRGQTDAFTYLDLMLRPQEYRRAPLIVVGKKQMRVEMADVLESELGMPEEQVQRFVESKRVSLEVLATEPVQELLNRWSQDLIRTARPADEILNAISTASQQSLASRLRIIPPPRGEADEGWYSIVEFHSIVQSEDGSGRSPFAEMDPEKKQRLSGAIESFVSSWQRDAATEDPEAIKAAAEEINAAVATIGEVLPTIRPDLYPSPRRLATESLYFQYGHGTWIWMIYLVAVIFLLMAVVYKWEGARFIGFGAFGMAFLMHTAALLVRWWISGRWPNSNMFEAVTTSVWLGTALAIGIEVLARRSSVRNFFVLTASVASMAAMMSAHFVSQLDPHISNMMPVLHDIWLYIHTNVIITSYAIIAMAAVTGVIYLVWRLLGKPPDYARVGGTGMLLEAAGETKPSGRIVKRSLGEVLDGATLVLMELAFVMLWAGIGMGAIWADHSWGRPWGWDPKEVFALNTFIVFVVLIHVRMSSKDKGLWTALLAVIGCGVMLFNWIVINFVISGLHSYA